MEKPNIGTGKEEEGLMGKFRGKVAKAVGIGTLAGIGGVAVVEVAHHLKSDLNNVQKIEDENQKKEHPKLNLEDMLRWTPVVPENTYAPERRVAGLGIGPKYTSIPFPSGPEFNTYKDGVYSELQNPSIVTPFEKYKDFFKYFWEEGLKDADVQSIEAKNSLLQYQFRYTRKDPESSLELKRGQSIEDGSSIMAVNGEIMVFHAMVGSHMEAEGEIIDSVDVQGRHLEGVEAKDLEKLGFQKKEQLMPLEGGLAQTLSQWLAKQPTPNDTIIRNTREVPKGKATLAMKGYYIQYAYILPDNKVKIIYYEK